MHSPDLSVRINIYWLNENIEKIGWYLWDIEQLRLQSGQV